MLEAAYELLRDNLTQQLDIDSNLAFVERCMDKYGLQGDIRQNLEGRIEEIRARQKDRRFNVSVIGEFSTGKSTFINAMLKQNLLKTNSLQGTTIASTIIEHDTSMSVEVQYQNGECNLYPCRNMDELKDTVVLYTSGIAEDADEDEGSVTARYGSQVPMNSQPWEQDGLKQKQMMLVDSVHIRLPSGLADGEIRIVDTPGTNVLELWHEDVTRNAIRKYSDTSIVLINAAEPMPESFLEFLHENLEDIIRQCIFVVTKIDLVRPKERDAIIKYIRVKLKAEFDIDDPVLMIYASQFVLEDAVFAQREENTPDDSASYANRDMERVRYRYNDRDELVKDSLKNERRIYQYVKQQRCMIQTKQMALLLERMFECLNERMIVMSQNAESVRKIEDIARTSRSIRDRKERMDRIKKNLDGMAVYY